MNFSEWLSEKKLDFMVETHNPKASDADFAEWLTDRLHETPEAERWRLLGHRFSWSTVNRWLVGGSLPAEDNLWGIIAIFGAEACSVLGIPPVVSNEPDLRRFITLWLASSEAERREVMEYAEMRLGRSLPKKVTP